MSDCWSSCVSRRRRASTTSPAVERWGPGTELAAATCSSFGLVAAGSFVKTEPELVPVEGVFKSALGGVNPWTDIAPTDKPKTTRRTTMPIKWCCVKQAQGFVGGIPTATPSQEKGVTADNLSEQGVVRTSPVRVLGCSKWFPESALLLDPSRPPPPF